MMTMPEAIQTLKYFLMTVGAFTTFAIIIMVIAGAIMTRRERTRHNTRRLYRA